jgi:hypothetical protein
LGRLANRKKAVGELKSWAVSFHTKMGHRIRTGRRAFMTVLEERVNNITGIGEQLPALLMLTQMRSLDFK